MEAINIKFNTKEIVKSIVEKLKDNNTFFVIKEGKFENYLILRGCEKGYYFANIKNTNANYSDFYKSLEKAIEYAVLYGASDFYIFDDIFELSRWILHEIDKSFITHIYINRVQIDSFINSEAK